MSTKQRTNRTSLSVENLEGRDLMSGNVTASIVGDDLVIRGDSASNNIYVRQVSSGRFSVTATGGTLNGTVGSRTFTVPDSIKIYANGGNDLVDVRGNATTRLKVFGDLTIDLGSGSDTADIRGVILTDDLSIETGKGIDHIRVRNLDAYDDISVTKSAENPGDYAAVAFSLVDTDANFNGGGKLTVDLYSGNDIVELFGIYAEQMAINTYGGNDYVSLGFTRRNPNLFNDFDTGSGRDTVNLFENYITTAGNVNHDPDFWNHEIVTRQRYDPLP
jgi:hypothetical protein